MRFLAISLERFRQTNPNLGIIFTLADDGPAQELGLDGTAHVAIATALLALPETGDDRGLALVTPLRRSATQRLYDAVSRRGLKLGHQYVVDDYHAMLGLVAADLAVACVPGLSLMTPDPRVIVRPCVEPMLRQVAAVSDRVSLRRDSHHQPLAALEEAAAEQDRWLTEVTSLPPGAR